MTAPCTAPPPIITPMARAAVLQARPGSIGLRNLWTMARGQPSHPPSCLAHCLHEGLDLHGILDALGLLHAATDIHRVRAHLADGLGDIVG